MCAAEALLSSQMFLAEVQIWCEWHEKASRALQEIKVWIYSQ